MDFKTNLPSRYEIRPLNAEHIEWASALIFHGTIFRSPIWPVLYPENKTARAYDGFKEVTYLVKHQIDSGHSLGVFDKDYEYKRPESASTEGRLYWDLADDTADGNKLLEQMDFPLVSIALAYDSINPLDYGQMHGLLAVLPPFGPCYYILSTRDKREPESWQANDRGQVLFRNATNTRNDYEGLGIMKALAQFMMHTAASKGFRGIQIESFSDAVLHVWSNPPAPFRGEVISEFHTDTYEEENERGEMVYPYRPASQRIAKIYCTLK